MAYPPTNEFVAFLNANPGRYRNNPEPDGYNSTEEINNTLTSRPLVTNDEPPQIEKPFTIADTQALLSNESMGKLSDTWWASYTVALEGNADRGANRANAIAFVINAETRVDILPDESAAIQAELNATIPDPTWPAQILGDSDAMLQWQMSGWSADYTNNALGR